MAIVVPRNLPLPDLLSGASSDDLNVLADLITDNGKGRVALDSKIKASIVTHRSKGTLQAIPEILDSEIRAFGSNSIANMFRSSSVEYTELATDVAKKLDGKPTAFHDVFDVEDMVMRLAISKYSEVKSFSDYAAMLAQVSQVVRLLVSTAGTIGGFAASGGAATIAGLIGGRLVTLAAPPLAVAAAGATIFQAASPAFRITVPAVLQVAKIRRTRFDADLTAYQESLRACL
ncbi:hypothetical protein [Pseudomonas sp. p106]|uniref:hypothetical protein n=1 Tax=Pseudomonas sp. p106 TaxID=2479854 RepID=UPI000F77DFD6|nr:hypothetical protein [Pseudomonas sp. p106]RRV45800.1 hypothetical protein EGJ09_12305 [Pseudomonas sp. p106]